MLTNVLLAIAAIAVLLIVVFIVVVAMQPSDFRILRRKQIAAPAATVFAHLNELMKWQAWSPWENLDPNLKRTYEGPPVGEGAKYSWSGNSKVGEGRMTIVDSRPDELVRIRLEFIRPFQATNTSEFALESIENQTVVTWSMTGKNTFMGKAFGLVMNMDKLIGADFEKGLTRLKSIAEGQA
ncbi:MAG: SRPBCC family protein [Pirellulaceae bacterium]|jgi:hypothetical protein|nr:SRPBCC family protein [Pirellulaceae bacterium]